MTTTTKPPALEWRPRAHVRERNGFRYRRIVSTCGRYAVEHSHYLNNHQLDKKQRLPDVYRAMVLIVLSHRGGGRPSQGWALIGRHRKQGPAKAACEAHARRAGR